MHEKVIFCRPVFDMASWNEKVFDPHQFFMMEFIYMAGELSPLINSNEFGDSAYRVKCNKAM